MYARIKSTAQAATAKASPVLLGFILGISFAFPTPFSMAADQLLCPQVFAKGLKKAPMDTVKVAVVQFPLGEKTSSDDFLKKIKNFVDQATDKKSDVIVFPELVTTELVNWQSKVSEADQLKAIAKDFTPGYIKSVSQWAVESHISILAGTTPRLVDGKVYNTAVLALPDGRILLQDKLFLTPDEKVWGWTPGRDLNVFDTPWGKSVITICFDAEFPGVSQALAPIQPEVIFVPSWTSSEAGFNRVDWATKGRAVEHYAFVIKTGTVPDKTSTQPHFGNATILGPQDAGLIIEPIEGKKNTTQIVYGTLDLAGMRKRRDGTGYYPSKEQGINPIRLNLNPEGKK